MVISDSNILNLDDQNFFPFLFLFISLVGDIDENFDGTQKNDRKGLKRNRKGLSRSCKKVVS